MASVHTDLERDVAKRFAELAEERCIQDGWSRAVRVCVGAAGSFADFDACEAQKTTSQQQALRRPNN